MSSVLDHVVVLVPHQVLAELPAWLAGALTVVPGGSHAGGQTENKLVLFADGTYIELIAFVGGLDPERRRSHRWGARPEGRIIDWALTLLGSSPGPGGERGFGEVQQRVRRAGAGIEYEDPVAGGRTTPEGVVLEWATSSPAATDEGEVVEFAGGELPFWCFDRTPRRLRVPYQRDELVQHPCGAVGVAGLAVLVKDEGLLDRMRRVYDAVLPAAHEEKAGGGAFRWELAVPDGRGGAKAHLELGLLDGARDAVADGPDSGPVCVRLALFVAGSDKPGKIAGQLVEGWRVEIDLVPLRS